MPATTSWLASAGGGKRKPSKPVPRMRASSACEQGWCWDTEGGALPRMLPPFRLGFGGRAGNWTPMLAVDSPHRLDQPDSLCDRDAGGCGSDERHRSLSP